MTNEEQFHLFDAIDKIPQFQGAGVAYIGEGECNVLRDSMHISGFDTWIVLESSQTTDDGKLQLPAPAVKPKSAFWKKLLGAGISCTSAVVTGVATAAETAAAPVTAGASLTLVYITGAGAVASSLQCGLSVGEIVDHFIDPDMEALLDSEQWFDYANDVCDVIAIAGARASVGQAVQGLIRLQKASGRSIKAIFKGMSRAERKRLARELAQYAGTSPTSNSRLSYAPVNWSPSTPRRVLTWPSRCCWIPFPARSPLLEAELPASCKKPTSSTSCRKLERASGPGLRLRKKLGAGFPMSRS